jgi:Uma2 family endonuclease
MNWQKICEDPALRDLPYKIETNRYGQIIMTPHRLAHSFYQSEIERLLREFLPYGVVLPECAIETRDGVKTADVAWMSRERYAKVKDDFAASIAPEICVEVISPSNTLGEIDDKITLYFAAGAQEVWICRDGAMSFYLTGKTTCQTNSELVPLFPSHVELP